MLSIRRKFTKVQQKQQIQRQQLRDVNSSMNISGDPALPEIAQCI